MDICLYFSLGGGGGADACAMWSCNLVGSGLEEEVVCVSVHIDVCISAVCCTCMWCIVVFMSYVNGQLHDLITCILM